MAKTVVRREREKNIKIRIDVSCWRDERNIEKFCDGECDLLYHRAFPSAEEDALLGKRFSLQESRTATVPLGYAQVAVIVNRANTVQQLTLDQVRALLRMRGADMHWSDLGGTGDIVNCFGESRDSMSRLVIRHACMMLGPDKPTGYYLYRKDFKQCSDAEEVVKKVKGDRNGIGFVLYRGQPLRGLKVIAIAKTEDNQAVDLKDGQIPHEGYPLLEPLVLYLSPDAPAGARELCTFATGPEGAKILKEQGVWPEYELKKVREELRLKDMQAGKGAPIRVSGLPGGETLARDLAVPYVKAKAVVQVKYREQGSQAEAVREFLDGGELLLTEGEVKRLAADGTSATGGEGQAEGEPPSPPTPLPQTGEGSKEPLPSAASPQGATLGVRAVGVVVHPDNGAKELTLEDLRLIYSGEINTWPGVEGTAGRIRIFGLASGSGAMKLVEERVGSGQWAVGSEGRRAKGEGRGAKSVGREGRPTPDPPRSTPSGRHARIERRGDTAKVVLSVANQPGAIGFVDLAQVARHETTVKLVAILPPGAKKAEAPTPETVPEGYPLARPVMLYLSPKASDTAKDFFEFVAGGNAREALVAHGIIPNPNPPKFAKDKTLAAVKKHFDQSKPEKPEGKAAPGPEEMASVLPKGPAVGEEKEEEKAGPASKGPSGEGARGKEEPAKTDRPHPNPLPEGEGASDAWYFVFGVVGLLVIAVAVIGVNTVAAKRRRERLSRYRR